MIIVKTISQNLYTRNFINKMYVLCIVPCNHTENCGKKRKFKICTKIAYYLAREENRGLLY